MSESNHKEWVHGLVALYVGPGDSSDELMLRNSYDHHERVSWPKGSWCTDPPYVKWMPDSGWSGPVWVGTSEEYRALRGRAETPADLLRIAREAAQTSEADTTVVIFGEEYVKASDSREALAQAEATIETLRQEARRACIAAERFGIYQSRADVAAESLASKMVDLRAEFEAYKRRTADKCLDAIRSVLGEPGGSVDLCVDKIRAYQEEIDDLRAEIEAHKRSAADAQMRRDDLVQCYAADTARLRTTIVRLRTEMDDIPGLLEDVLGFRPNEVTVKARGFWRGALDTRAGLCIDRVDSTCDHDQFGLIEPQTTVRMRCIAKK